MKLRCDTCGVESDDIDTKSEIEAQRALITFFKWRVYPRIEGLLMTKWKRACPKCTKDWGQRQAIMRTKQKKLEKLNAEIKNRKGNPD